MSTNRLKLLYELKENQVRAVTPETMKIMVADKKQRRAKKGLDFNCLVLDCETNTNELEQFLNSIETQKRHLQNNTRFQILYRTRHPASNDQQTLYHWSTIDLRIHNGKLEFYLVDAAHVLASVFKTMATIQQRCPNASISYSGGSLQQDMENCAYFALDHAYRLAKIPDLHDQLPEMEFRGNFGDFDNYHLYYSQLIKDKPHLVNNLNKDAISEAINHFRFIPLDKFPAEFGPLLRNMQFLSRLKITFFNHQLKGNDKVSLDEYVSKRSDRHSNNSILHKSKSIQAKASFFLNSLDEKEYCNITRNNEFKLCP